VARPLAAPQKTQIIAATTYRSPQPTGWKK
jgi:hypothetical protein